MSQMIKRDRKNDLEELRQIIRSQYPDLSDEQVERMAAQVFEKIEQELDKVFPEEPKTGK